MTSFLLVLLVFGVSFFAHIVLHRLLLARGIITIKSTNIYLLGLLILVGFIYVGRLAFPVTSLVFYILLWSLAVVFYLTPYLGGESPASMILSSFRKKRQQTHGDLVDLFTNTGLIWKRLEDLQRAGLVTKRGTAIAVNAKGAIAAWLVVRYQQVFNRRLVG